MISIATSSDVQRSRVRVWTKVAAIWLLAFGMLPLASAVASAETRSLKLYFVHTGEKAEIVFKRNGRYDAAGLQKINRFLRDWRRNEPTKMNPRLLDLVWTAYQQTGSSNYINVVSAYRSPATNSMLRSRSKGVAKKSQHMLGNAMDFFIPGVQLKKLREIGLKMQGGGVGYYPTSGSPFVHMDVGNVRHWPKMSRRELVAVFPNGNTLHVPSDGKPLPGFDQALASYEARKRSGGTALALASTGNSGGKKSGGLLARLFGGGGGVDDEEDSSPMMAASDERQAPAIASSRKAAPAAAGDESDTPPGVQPPVQVLEPAQPRETIVAALPERAPLLPQGAPRPRADIGAVAGAPANMPFGMNDDVPGTPATLPQATAAAEAYANVPLPTRRPKYTPVDDGSMLLAMADTAPVPTERPTAADAIADLVSVPEPRPELVASAAQAVEPLAAGDRKLADQEIASLIDASEPRDLTEEQDLANTPVNIITQDEATSKSTGKSARPTSRDSKPAAGSIIVPAQPSDARWAFGGNFSTKAKPGEKAPAFAYNIVRTAPREVYASGFQPNTRVAEANRFSGNAVAFLPVAKFETN